MAYSCRTLLWGPTKVSKSQPSRLQNERFVRDFLKNSYFESYNQAFRPRLPPKVTRQVSKTGSPIGAHTHIKKPCQTVSRFQSLHTTPAHTPIPMSQRHSPPPQLATCACHENRISTPQNPHKVLRLPRKVTIYPPSDPAWNPGCSIF